MAAGGFEPHHDVITQAGQTQIYEAEYADEHGRPTISLTRAAAYRKDNRILPVGFDGAQAPAAIRPAGVSGDRDFAGGRDTTAYRIPLRVRPQTFEVEALFENIRSTDALALSSAAHPDIADFLARWRERRAPAVLARVVTTVR